MSQYLGRVKISANGVVLDTKPGASINLGGVKRTPVTNDHDMGNSESLEPSQIKCEVSLKKGERLEPLRTMTGATCVFECDTGQRYIVKDAFTTDTLEITGGEGGRVGLTIVGKPAQEVTS